MPELLVLHTMIIMTLCRLLPGHGGTPNIITNSIGMAVPTEAIRAAYPKQISILTDKKCRLREVRPSLALRLENNRIPYITILLYDTDMPSNPLFVRNP